MVPHPRHGRAGSSAIDFLVEKVRNDLDGDVDLCGRRILDDVMSRVSGEKQENDD